MILKEKKGKMERPEVEDSFRYEPDVPQFYKKAEPLLNGRLPGRLGRFFDNAVAYRFDGMYIVVTGEISAGKRWIHVSFSRQNRLPSYKDLQRIRRDFIGEDRQSIMIFPEKERYVNVMKNCLHLFCCLDNDGLPCF